MLKSSPFAPTPSSSQAGSFKQEINANRWPKFAAMCGGLLCPLSPSAPPPQENKAVEQRMSGKVRGQTSLATLHAAASRGPDVLLRGPQGLVEP